MVHKWRTRAAPLGMDEGAFAFFTRTLELALAKDDILSCEVRLKGSSATFFSNPRKRMPWTREEIVDLFVESTGDYPQLFVIERIERTLQRLWPNPTAHPTQRPFDLLHRLGIALSPSDYDIQISSDEIDARARQLVLELAVDPAPHRIQSQEYDFIKKHLFHEACEHLDTWAAHCSKVLRREVSIAAFPLSGPPDRSDEIGDKSSHHRPSDWVILVKRNG